MNIQEVKAILMELGSQPKKSLGQNFLVSEYVIGRIIEEAQKSECEKIIEVGPGIGSLTRELLKIEKDLTLIELDSSFSQYWRDKKVSVIEGDALKVNWSDVESSNTLFISNLPYQISSSIVIERSVFPFGVKKMILMFQKEVAQRILAKPGGKDYGLLSVIAQTFWNIKNLLEAGPKDFYPPPNVASRVLVFESNGQEGLREKGYLNFVKAAFSQRRKMLWKNLLREYKPGTISKDALVGVLVGMGIDEKVRVENISIQQFCEMYERVNKIGH